MDHRLLEAYLDYSGQLARAGIIDDSLTENIDDDRPLDARIADILRAAGRLPEGWDQASSRTGRRWSLRRDRPDAKCFVRPVPDQPRPEGRVTRPLVALKHGRDWAVPMLAGPR
jgi:hypothetical protein